MVGAAVSVVVALATLALTWASQRGVARKDYVELMEKALDERLKNCEAAKAEMLVHLAEARSEAATARAENVDLMRRLFRLESAGHSGEGR